MKLIKIPALFLYDHEDRGCPTPLILERGKRFAVIDGSDIEGLADLIDDAKHYAGGWVDDCEYSTRVLKPAARRLLAVLTNH